MSVKFTHMETVAMIILYREVKPIKNGWCSRCVNLGLAAHGFSPEVADKNLERVVRLFFAPAQREGTLVDELAALGLEPIEDGENLQFVFDASH
ncbi:MAG: hypothetical protein M3R24_20460 [Chloroflexota bacterium]|nr:hypothetical protein [Chloroflexota bacterium]